MSLGTFGKSAVASFGKFAKQIYFNAELPPVTGSHEDLADPAEGHHRPVGVG